MQTICQNLIGGSTGNNANEGNGMNYCDQGKLERLRNELSLLPVMEVSPQNAQDSIRHIPSSSWGFTSRTGSSFEHYCTLSYTTTSRRQKFMNEPRMQSLSSTITVGVNLVFETLKFISLNLISLHVSVFSK